MPSQTRSIDWLGKAPPPKNSAARAAYMGFLRGMLADLPAPDEMLTRLSLPQMAALRTAWRTQDSENEGCWRISNADANLLRATGLVEAIGPHLTGFGTMALLRLRELEQ